MFMVFNKDRIISYIVSFGTVIMLFMIPMMITDDKQDVIATSTNTYNIQKNTIRLTNNIDNETNTNIKNEINEQFLNIENDIVND